MNRRWKCYAFFVCIFFSQVTDPILIHSANDDMQLWNRVDLTERGWIFDAPSGFVLVNPTYNEKGLEASLYRGAGFIGYIAEIIVSGTGLVYAQADVEVSDPNIDIAFGAINLDRPEYNALSGTFNAAMPLSARRFENTGTLSVLIRPEGGFVSLIVQAVLPDEADSPWNASVCIKEIRYALLANRSSEEILSILDPASQRIAINPGNKAIRIGIQGIHPSAKPLEMIPIPAGSFVMGSPITEKDRDPNESPQHEVTITKPFYLGKYEVTQAQWEAVLDGNPSSFQGNPDRPVERVSWDDCQVFIHRLNEMGVGQFRLPTEAEWKYACRAGTSTRYYWGDDLFYLEIDDYAWYDRNSGGRTHPVGEKKPNPWGLYDMSGNVWEWTQDWFGPYPNYAVVDPTGPTSGAARVGCGGGWSGTADFCRSADRGNGPPDYRNPNIGFRLVRTYP